MTKNWKKFTAEKNWLFFLYKEIPIELSLGLHKGRTSYRRSLQPSKKNIQHFKTWKIFTFFYICRSFLPSWIRIRIQQLKLMRIHNPGLFFSYFLDVSVILRRLLTPTYDTVNKGLVGALPNFSTSRKIWSTNTCKCELCIIVRNFLNLAWIWGSF